MGAVLQDLRYALRSMARAPGFALAAVLSLALGIGANTAVFSVIDSALLQPLPVAAPEQLVHLSTDRVTNVNLNYSYRHYIALRDRGPFAGVLAHSMTSLAVRVDDAAEQIEGAAVSGNFFDVLGVQVNGRAFAADEDVPGAARNVVVLSHVFWQRSFGGRSDVFGRTIEVNGQPFTVIGVAERGFDGIVRTQAEAYWVPLAVHGALFGDDLLGRPRTSWLDVVARLPAGTPIEQAQLQLGTLDPALRELDLIDDEHRNVLAPLARGIQWAVSPLERPLTYLLAAVAVVLLIACANVAALLLARASARQRELAVRLALGGSRRRIAQQLFTEAFLLAAAAGAAGVLFAIWIGDALGSWPTAIGNVEVETTLNGRVLAFALLVTSATGILFGVLPAFEASRPDLMPALKERNTKPARVTARSALVVAQVALSLTLLVGATMLVRTLRNLTAVEIGYTTRNALLASIDLDAQGYDAQRGRLLTSALLERVRALPGVVSASVATTIAPSPGGSRFNGVELEGYAGATDDVEFDYNKVDPAYFDVLGIRIVRGRGLTEADATAATPVVVINEQMARRYWPDQDAIGRRIFLDDERTMSWEVVGVAADGKLRELREAPAANVWRSIQQSYAPRFTLIVRTHGDPLALTAAVRSELRALDPGVPLFGVRSLQQHIALATGEERMAAGVAGGFSIVALLLAALGIYGVLAFVVTQRRREIGIRMALGAHRRNVLLLVLRRALALTALGVALGVPGALLSTRLLQSTMFGVTPGDVTSYVAAAALLIMVATAAAFLPARRATAVDPIVTLRHDADG